MSLRPTLSVDVPASTATVARAAFPRGNPYLHLRDRLGTIFTDAQFAPLFASWGSQRNVLGGWRL
jgi:transposase